MKKLLLIVLAVAGLLFATASESKAGVSIGIGFGVPGGYYPYPAYYPYGYGYYPYPVYGPVFRAGYCQPYYWYHGRRCYYGRPYRR